MELIANKNCVEQTEVFKAVDGAWHTCAQNVLNYSCDVVIGNSRGRWGLTAMEQPCQGATTGQLIACCHFQLSGWSVEI